MEAEDTSHLVPSYRWGINQQQQLQAMQRLVFLISLLCVCVCPCVCVPMCVSPFFSLFKDGREFLLQGVVPRGRLTSIAAVPSISTAAFTVGLPQSREPAFPMLALDRLAGVKQILLFITEDAPMALQTLTAVGERIDGQAGAVHTSAAQEEGRNGHELGRGDKNAGRVMERIGRRWANGLTSVSLTPTPWSPSLLPFFLLPSLPGFCLEG